MCRQVLSLCLVALLAGLVGCRQPAGSQSARPSLFNWGADSGNRSPFSLGAFAKGNSGATQLQARSPEEYERLSELAEQINALNQRLTNFDSDNQQLLTEVASLKQKLQVANDYNNQLKQQLADSAAQLQQLANQNRALQTQMAQNTTRFASASGATPSQLPGAATLRANNSLMQKLSAIQIPGGQARMDGDVIRIEFPSELLFNPGTYQIRPDQQATLASLVRTIQQHFPRQIVGIEAHWDGTPLNPPTTTHHQLTATQALAVFNALAQLGLPSDQMFTMAMGSNRPRHSQNESNGVHPNRRIEVVIYPETYDGM